MTAYLRTILQMIIVGSVCVVWWMRPSGLASVVAASYKPRHNVSECGNETMNAADGPQSCLFFIGVVSAPLNTIRRNAMRVSWLNAAAFSLTRQLMQSATSLDVQFEYKFFVARTDSEETNEALSAEAEKHGDMVLLFDFVDSYNGLVLKTRGILQHAVEKSTASFVLKCDDDSFVRLEAIMSAIVETYDVVAQCPPGNVMCTWTPRPFVLGNIAPMISVRTSLGKTGDPHQSTSFEENIPDADSVHGYYPQFPRGSGYVISRPLAVALVETNKVAPLRLLRAEDVSVGYWIYRLHVARHFSCGLDYVSTYSHLIVSGRAVKCSPSLMVLHYVSPDKMICLSSNVMHAIGTRLAMQKWGGINATQSLSAIISHLQDWCC
jgi:hypothetical protein